MGKLPLKFRDRGSIFIGFIFAAPVVIALVIYGIWFATHSSARALVCEVAKKAATSFVEQNHDFVSLDQAKIAAENTAADYAASLGLIDGSGTTELYPLIVSQYTIPASERIAYATVLLPAQAARVGRVSDGGQAGASGSSYTDPKTGRTVVTSEEAPNAVANEVFDDVPLPAPPPATGSPIIDSSRFLAENLPSKAVAVGTFSFLGFSSRLYCSSVTSAVINSSFPSGVIPPAPPTPGFPPAAPPAGGSGGAGGGVGGPPAGGGGSSGALSATPATDCGDGSPIALAEEASCGGPNAAWLLGVRYTASGAPELCSDNGTLSASCCKCMTKEEAMLNSRFNNAISQGSIIGPDGGPIVECVMRKGPDGAPPCNAPCWACKVRTPKEPGKKPPSCPSRTPAYVPGNPKCPAGYHVAAKSGEIDCCLPNATTGEGPGIPAPKDPEPPVNPEPANPGSQSICPVGECIVMSPDCKAAMEESVTGANDASLKAANIIAQCCRPCGGVGGSSSESGGNVDLPSSEMPTDPLGLLAFFTPEQLQLLRNSCIPDGSAISCDSSMQQLLTKAGLIMAGAGVGGQLVFECSQPGASFSLATGSCGPTVVGPVGGAVAPGLREPGEVND